MILSKKIIMYLLFGAGMFHAATNLPTYINLVRKAQFQLIQDSKASKWGTPWTPSAN
ncbi:MAG: hypothetical protein KDD33_12885 [Bdellovibrionales bacterium]|nr:hypothetical protein [Bdellovibrionales bacterium]